MSTPTSIQRVHRSQVIVGDGSVAVQIQPGGETTLQAADGLLDSLTLHHLPALRVPPGRSTPVGRGSVLAAATADLDAGRHVQLVGTAGVGRAAVARALVGHWAAANRPGAVLLAGAEAHTLDSLYTRLSGLFFDRLWHRPEESALRTVTGRLGPSGLIVIVDCDLPGPESEQLIETFPQCRFLLTSTSPTLESAGSVHEVTALGPADVEQLVSQALGRELSDLEREQAQAAHRLSGGRAAALVACAAFLRRAAESAQPTDLVALPPERQAELLLAGFDDTARRVVAALAAFGPAPAALFPALGETISGAESDRLAFTLMQAGLIQESDDGYVVSADIATVAGGVSPAQTYTIAGRLHAAYSRTDDSGSPPAAFSLEVVRALVATRQWEPASRLARAASAEAVATGRMEPWSELVSLGAQAAREADLTDDLRYFLRQQHTDALLRDDLAAAAILLASLSTLLHATPPPTPAPLTRLRPARRALRTGRRLATAGHGASTVVGAIAVAAVAGAAIGSTQGPRHSATPTPHTAASSSAPALAPWMQAPATTAPTWTLTMSATPLTALPAGAGTVSAQFPTISAGITDPVQRTKAETALQQPIQQIAAAVAKRADSAKSAGIQNPGYGAGGQTVPQETTTVTQAGDLVSVVYHFNGDNGGGPDMPGALAILMRKDNAAVIPQQAILAASVTTPEGAARLNSVVNSLVPASTGGSQYPVIATGCSQSSGAGFVGPAIAVTPTGLVFYVGTGADACAGGIAVTVPYSQLNGLVNPLITNLVAVKEGT